MLLENLRENWYIVLKQFLMLYLRLIHLSASWEKLLFEADNNQPRAHNWPSYRDKEILECSFHETTISYTFFQGLVKDCKSQRWYMTTQKHCLLDASGSLNIWTRPCCGIIHNTCVSPNQIKFQHREERWSWSPDSMEIFATDSFCERDSQF